MTAQASTGHGQEKKAKARQSGGCNLSVAESSNTKELRKFKLLFPMKPLR